MISAITPVYRESIDQINAVIAHLSEFNNISEIIIAATQQDPDFKEIESWFATQIEPVKLVVTQQAGRAAQMNQAAEVAKSDYLVFLHCDTRLPDNADKLIIELLSKRQWGRFNVQLDDNKWMFQLISWFINKRSRLTQISTGDQAIFTQRLFFERLGGFPNQALMEDVEFSKRAKQKSEPAFIHDPVITSARRWQKGGIVRTILLMWWLRALYWLGVSPDRLAKVYRQIR